MSKTLRSGTLRQDVLLATLQTCVDEVFTLMVSSFKDAAVRSVEAVQPQTDEKIRYCESGNKPRSVDVHKQVLIAFSGDASGRVVLRCSIDGAETIARGLLMMEDYEVLELDAVADALGECANMLAGSLKSKALDPVGTFKLGLPDFSDPKPGGTMEGALVYRVADGVMSVEVWLD